jgi:hypothetical protein
MWDRSSGVIDATYRLHLGGAAQMCEAMPIFVMAVGDSSLGPTVGRLHNEQR